MTGRRLHLQRQPQPGAAPTSAPVAAAGGGGARPTAEQLLGAGGGQPLPAAVRGSMESMFGARFDRVRLHRGHQAGAYDAAAMTVGERIFLPHGHADLQSPEGQSTLAHELTHVLQQRAGRVRAPGPGVHVDPDPALEAEAEAAGQAVAVQRKPRLGLWRASLGAGQGGAALQRRRKRRRMAPPARPRKGKVHQRLAESMVDRMGVGKDPASPAGMVAGGLLRAGLGVGLRSMRGEAGSLRHAVTGYLMGKALGDKPGKGQPTSLLGAVGKHFRDGFVNNFKQSPAYRTYAMAKGLWSKAARRRDQMAQGDRIRAERRERRNPTEQEMQPMDEPMFGSLFDEPQAAPVDAKDATPQAAVVKDGGAQPQPGFAQQAEEEEAA